MIRWVAAGLLLMLYAAPAGLRAGPFVISLEVSDEAKKQTAQLQPAAKANAIVKRPSLKAAAGARFTAKWKVSSGSKELMKDVLVHFYVVRIDKPGQMPPPLEPKSVVIESALTMDFAAKDITSGELQFRPLGAGIYLVRIEAQDPAQPREREYFAAMDLVVK
ncbi:MAG TPA: hypothetical protein VFC78_22235 [Tepidisphaeraceae bacterium]|nr:hypothetical protein [Tepidisphaeraceae bacterium]